MTTDTKKDEEARFSANLEVDRLRLSLMRAMIPSKAQIRFNIVCMTVLPTLFLLYIVALASTTWH